MVRISKSRRAGGVWNAAKRHSDEGVWNQILRNPSDFESLILMTGGFPLIIVLQKR
jgi:hypothetical protein